MSLKNCLWVFSIFCCLWFFHFFWCLCVFSIFCVRWWFSRSLPATPLVPWSCLAQQSSTCSLHSIASAWCQLLLMKAETSLIGLPGTWCHGARFHKCVKARAESHACSVHHSSSPISRRPVSHILQSERPSTICSSSCSQCRAWACCSCSESCRLASSPHCWRTPPRHSLAYPPWRLGSSTWKWSLPNTPCF